MKEDGSDPRANLEYVRDMIEQLKVVSGVEKGAILLYFLDMAKLETEAWIARLDQAAEGPPA
ncbi:hypothetical protein [Jiella avicenniae]|uniref:Uncharacterized protein n=1 Tax=Jiella avicenniae TaxID=2907202 RepID=A0A9X1NZ96_9HYPH|nr:hypothetical protein [Jiella avicenniae]MCE7028232.1 hypothetical protein [Jiella avicenniae]